MSSFAYEPCAFGHIEVDGEPVLVRYKIRSRYFVLTVRTAGPLGDRLDKCERLLLKQPRRIERLLEGDMVIL